MKNAFLCFVVIAAWTNVSCSDSGHVVGMTGSGGTASGGSGTGTGGAAGEAGSRGGSGVAGVSGTGGVASGTGGAAGSGGAGASGGASGHGGTTATGGNGGRGGNVGTGGTGTGGAATGGSGGSASGGAGAGSGGAGGTGGTGTGGNTGGAGGAGGAAPCLLSCTSTFPECCSNACVWTVNDPENCGGCGIKCSGTTPFCQGSLCVAQPCTATDAGACGTNCCGTSCCGTGEICCSVNSPVGPMRPACAAPSTGVPRCPGNIAVASDRNIKRDIVPADEEAVLARLRALPISTWSYLAEPPAVHHLGPMAQDFHAAFGLGSDDRTYDAVDGHGVALAAIQALDRQMRRDHDHLEALERENRHLRRRLLEIERRRASTAPQISDDQPASF